MTGRERSAMHRIAKANSTSTLDVTPYTLGQARCPWQSKFSITSEPTERSNNVLRPSDLHEYKKDISVIGVVHRVDAENRLDSLENGASTWAGTQNTVARGYNPI